MLNDFFYKRVPPLRTVKYYSHHLGLSGKVNVTVKYAELFVSSSGGHGFLSLPKDLLS